jgi:21S rRNA (GM2251-2'-O)-methyltransferase
MRPYAFSSSLTQRRSSTFDDQGRRIRNRSNNDDNDGWAFDGEPSANPARRTGGDSNRDRWGDSFNGDQEEEKESAPSWSSFRNVPRGSNDRSEGSGRERSSSSSGGGDGRFRRNSGGGGSRFSGNSGGGGSSSSSSRSGSRYGSRDSFRRPQATSADPDARERKINMNALEGAGFVHLYGLAPVLNALHANLRDMTDPNPISDQDESNRKPEAQFRPWLFVQEKSSRSGRGADKARLEQAILKLAAERNVPVATVDKGVLNALSGNRPHQGVCLRCGRLGFTPISRIPLPDEKESGSPRLWLVLDEVVDPQNFGALLRSAYFLGGTSHVRVLVCGKNSAPPSPIVSAASAGALEVLPVFSTSNLPRTLATAEQDGFTVLGASSHVRDLDTPVYDLHELPPGLVEQQPTVLVLGSEGSGLRHLVATSCTHFVRIPAGGGAVEGDEDDLAGPSVAGVDSLNVSVTGGILLWRLLAGGTGR